MYELIVLSLLMRQPAHGYLIAKIINDIIGPIARASNGRIYPLLAKFVETGLIEAFDTEHDERQMRTYRITDAGRSRFHELMMDTTSNPKEYPEIFSFKVTVFSSLPPAEQLLLIDHYIHFCRAHIMHLSAALPGMETGSKDCCLNPPPGPGHSGSHDAPYAAVGARNGMGGEPPAGRTLIALDDATSS